VRTVAIVGSRVLLGLAIIATGLLAPGTASAHDPAASAACNSGLPRLTIDLTYYNGENNIKVINDGDTLIDEDFGNEYHRTVRLGSGYVGHTVVVKVWAHDDPDGSEGWSKTFHLSTPPCKERDEWSFYGRFVGPCEDPMYAAVLRNKGDRGAAMKWVRIDRGARKVIERWVPAHRTITTAFRHVDGGTVMLIKARGQVVARQRSAPGGNYADCPR
jgi:hypothetical protein